VGRFRRTPAQEQPYRAAVESALPALRRTGGCGAGAPLGISISDHQENLDLLLRPGGWRLQRAAARVFLSRGGCLEMPKMVPAVRVDRYELDHGLHGQQYN